MLFPATRSHSGLKRSLWVACLSVKWVGTPGPEGYSFFLQPWVLKLPVVVKWILVHTRARQDRRGASRGASLRPANRGSPPRGPCGLRDCPPCLCLIPLPSLAGPAAATGKKGSEGPGAAPSHPGSSVKPSPLPSLSLVLTPGCTSSGEPFRMTDS